MIGRFAKPGVYRELLTSIDFYTTFAGGLLAAVSYILDRGRPSPGYAGMALALASVAINGLPIIWGAIRGLLRRRINVDELVSLAIAASLAQGEFLTAAVVGFVMTLGGLIERATSESARRAIKSLIRMTPQTAIRLDGQDAQQVVPVEQVAAGDRILVKPGDRIPVDAVILSGISTVDESSMTGEHLPRQVRAGDSILAGTLNHNGVLEARAVKVGRDTTLGKVIQMVGDAERHRPEAVRLIDRYARWFTPAILACAAAAWWLTGEAGRAVAVLIVGCPCALILAAPTATVAALGRAATAGVLVKGGQYLERLAAVKAVFFDKTGTLTIGEPRVEEIACLQGVNREELLACAAGAEQNCTHPLARAVLKAAHYAKITVRKAENAFHEIGLGVKAVVDGALVEVGGLADASATAAFPADLRSCLEQSLSRGATPLVVYRDHAPVGVLDVSDPVRPAAPAMVARFRKLGIGNIAVLSGDHEQAVARVAQSVGIDRHYARLKPDRKAEVIGQVQGRSLPVMFIGDGVNDAPALAAASVGVAMGAAGTDVALETADIALTHDDITRLPWLMKLSRRMLTVIKVNIAFGLVFNAAAVIAGGLGFLTPIAAAMVHNAGSVLVVIASASLAVFPEK